MKIREKMKVEFLGTGTSQGVPVVACQCPICQSHDPLDKRLRTAIHVMTEDASIVIDTGPDFRHQMLRAGIMDIDAVLITHEHNDHIAGLDDIRPFFFKQSKEIDIYALPRVIEMIKKKFDYFFVPNPYPGVPRVSLRPVERESFMVNETLIQCLPVYHGKLGVVGFRIGSFSYITDANDIPDETMALLSGTRVLVLNALRRELHHSHFNLEQAIDIGSRLGVEKLYLTHLSHTMGLHVDIQSELPPWVEPAHDGLQINVES